MQAISTRFKWYDVSAFLVEVEGIWVKQRQKGIKKCGPIYTNSELARMLGVLLLNEIKIQC